MEHKPTPKAFSVAQVAKIDDLVQYQDGAVVSREIVRKPTGTVTLFSFDAGQGLNEHAAPFDALVFVLDGAVDVTISGENPSSGHR